MEYLHGGDVYAHPGALDFSANLSPLGMPAGVRQAAAQSLEACDRYPDPFCRQLRAALAEREGIPETHLLCGAGAADLIYRFVGALRPGCALVTAPVFLEYEAALAACGCRVKRHLLLREEGFEITPRILEEITPEVGLVILVNPNNPIGRCIPPGLLDEIARRCRQTGAWLLLDECFFEFLSDLDRHSLIGLTGQWGGLVVLRAFTKAYGMAGLRLGWCACGEEEMLRRMAAQGQPWPVSTPAQAAGLAALQEEAYLERLRSLIRQEAPRMAAQLRQMGFWVAEPQANYVFWEDPLGRPLAQLLEQKGILIRSCGNFHGLGAQHFRAAVRMPQENRRLLAALNRIVER